MGKGLLGTAAVVVALSLSLFAVFVPVSKSPVPNPEIGGKPCVAATSQGQLVNLGCYPVPGHDSLTQAWFGFGAFSAGLIGSGWYYSVGLAN